MFILIIFILCAALIIVRSMLVASVITGLIFLFISGLNIVLKPESKCYGDNLGCFAEPHFDPSVGYIFMFLPILLCAVYAYFRYN